MTDSASGASRRRRGHQEHAVYRDGDRWRGAVDVGWDSDGRRVRKKVSGRTKGEVLTKLRELQQRIDSGMPMPDDRLTVRAFLQRWLTTTLPGHVADSTHDDYADTVRLHLEPGLGRIVLSQLAVANVDALWSAKRAQGYSGNSIRIMRAVLRKALDQACREGIVVRNVAALSAPPRVSAREGRSLTVEQARTLLEALRDHRLEPLIVVTLTYGLRRGEALGLRWRGLDWPAATLHVRHGVKRVKVRDEQAHRRTELVIGDLKTRRSRRTLYLTPPVVRLLQEQDERLKDERSTAGSAWQDHDLIFPTPIGTPIDPDNFSHTFSRLCRNAGLGHWHPHELRHSGASLMLAQGIPLHVVSEVLGHASIAVTKDVYGHLVEGDKRGAAQSLSDLFFGE